MNCAQCHAHNPAGNAFCHACGASLAGVGAPPEEAGLECSRCGATNRPQAKYCKGCGMELGGRQPQFASTSSLPPPPAASSRAAQPPPSGPTECRSCRGPLDPGARFCKFCGTPNDPSLRPRAAPGGGHDAPPQPASGPAMAPVTAGLPAIRAQVVVILRDGSEGGVYALEGERTDIGSREGDIVLRDDPYLAPRHARIEQRGDTFVLLDLGSANGIYVRLRDPVALSDGDMILIGQQVLRFESVSEAERQVGPATQHGVMVFGTPETPRLARLTQYTTEGLGRDVYYLYRDETVLGREMADIVFSDDPFLSRRHAAIALDQGRFTLRDLGSSNGTSVRCRREQRLQQGDQFRVGRHLFRFDLAPSGRDA